MYIRQGQGQRQQIPRLVGLENAVLPARLLRPSPEFGHQRTAANHQKTQALIITGGFHRCCQRLNFMGSPKIAGVTHDKLAFQTPFVAQGMSVVLPGLNLLSI